MNDQLTEAQNSGYNPYADREGATHAPCAVLRLDSRAQHSGHMDQESGCWCPGHGTVIESSAGERHRRGAPADPIPLPDRSDELVDAVRAVAETIDAAGWRQVEALAVQWPGLTAALRELLQADGREWSSIPSYWR